MTFVLPYDASKFVKGAPNIGDYVYANDLAISDYLNLFSQTTPGIEGALLVGIASGAYTNFIPTSDTVSGALDGIDAALNTINVGIGRVTDGAALNCPQPIADYYFIGNGTEIVTINPFTYTQGGIAYAIPSQTATFTPTDFADARIDILVIRNGSIAAPLAGTAAPVPVPDFAQVQDGDQILAFVYITSTGGADPDILQTDIYPVMHFQGELICQSGGGNYVINSSFECYLDNGPGVDDDFTEWIITTDVGVTGLIKADPIALYGDNSINITLNNITAGPGNKEIRSPLFIETDKDYTASIWIKNPGCGCNALVFAGIEYTWQGAIYEINILGCETKYGLKDTTGKSESEITASTWEHHAGTFKVPNGATEINVKLYIRGETLPVTLSVLFDAMKVECGCTATCYTSSDSLVTILTSFPGGSMTFSVISGNCLAISGPGYTGIGNGLFHSNSAERQGLDTVGAGFPNESDFYFKSRLVKFHIEYTWYWAGVPADTFRLYAEISSNANILWFWDTGFLVPNYDNAVRRIYEERMNIPIIQYPVQTTGFNNFVYMYCNIGNNGEYFIIHDVRWYFVKDGQVM